MKRLIETVVRRLADNPDAARVSESYEGKTAVYEVDVPEADRRPPDRTGRPHHPGAARVRVGCGDGARQARRHPRPRLNETRPEMGRLPS
jgi:hypothetical protein